MHPSDLTSWVGGPRTQDTIARWPRIRIYDHRHTKVITVWTPHRRRSVAGRLSTSGLDYVLPHNSTRSLRLLNRIESVVMVNLSAQWFTAELRHTYDVSYLC